MKPGTLLAIGLLAVIALAHVARLLLGTDVVVGGVTAPTWVSAVGVGVPTFIAGLLWREGRGRGRRDRSTHLRRHGLDDIDLTVPYTDRLLFAVTQVPGSTLACAARGDAAMFATLRAYYALAVQAAAGVGGRFIKGMGDGVLLAFPPDRAAAAVAALRAFQERATALWRGFDERCHVQIKVGAGVVHCGLLGGPGAADLDIVGDALNALFKAPWSDFHVSPDAAALLTPRGGPDE